MGQIHQLPNGFRATWVKGVAFAPGRRNSLTRGWRWLGSSTAEESPQLRSCLLALKLRWFTFRALLSSLARMVLATTCSLKSWDVVVKKRRRVAWSSSTQDKEDLGIKTELKERVAGGIFRKALSLWAVRPPHVALRLLMYQRGLGCSPLGTRWGFNEYKAL